MIIMKKSITKKLIVLTATLLATVSLGAFAASPKANWTETFKLKGGNWVTHTPTYVSYNDMIKAGKELEINNLDLKTDSTREEFVNALIRSGEYPA